MVVGVELTLPISSICKGLVLLTSRVVALTREVKLVFLLPKLRMVPCIKATVLSIALRTL